jgi:two-component sensor histidine kinase
MSLNSNLHIEQTLKNEIEEYFATLKLNVATQMSYVFTVLFIILSFFNYFDTFAAFIPMFIGLVISIISVFTTRKKHYLPAFYMFSVGAVLVSGFSLILLVENLHFGDMLWMLAGTSLAFFGIGKKLGTVLTVISLIIISYFIYFSLNINIENSKPISYYQKLLLLFELCGVIAANFYVFFMFLKINRFSKIKLQDTYDNLLIQNRLIVDKTNENTILLKEVHHRVKNNLQMVISLLRMQSDECKDEETRVYFQTSINRILSMSIVHQMLYQNENISAVKLEDYLKDLMQVIIRNKQESFFSVKHTIHSEVEKVGMKTIIPIGLIVNELMNQSLLELSSKVDVVHFTLQIQQMDENRLKLMYSDGFLNQSTQAMDESFAFVLINALIKQLSGTHTIEHQKDRTLHVITVKYDKEVDVFE